MAARRIDPIHELAKERGLILGEQIELGEGTNLLFLSNPEQTVWIYFMLNRQGNGRFLTRESPDHYPNYRAARVAAWIEFINHQMPATYEQRVGFAWDKLVAQPPKSISIQ